jgi:hypothetical protein
MSRLEEIQQRWDEIERELAAIAEGKVIEGDPAKSEEELLEEQDGLEYEGGLFVFPDLASVHRKGK